MTELFRPPLSTRPALFGRSRRPARAKGQTEQQLQMQVAAFLEIACPRGSSGVDWTCFPAGGGGKIRGAFLRAMGLRPGMPDFQLIFEGRYFGIELKTATGTVSAEQRLCHADIRSADGQVGVARSIDDVIALLDEWAIPMRARIGG